MPDTRPGEPTAADPVSDEFRDLVQRTLLEFVDRQQVVLAPLGRDLDVLFDEARVAVTGGKRLRPAFAYWGWRAAGGKQSRVADLVRAAAALEVVHASALIHDDLMDASDTRRGRPTAHCSLATAIPQIQDASTRERFGSSAAMLLGDVLLAWSDELLHASGFKPSAVERARPYFDRLRSEVVAGQYLDVLAQSAGRTSSADAMRVVRYKSAKYTVERPLQFGAALGKGSSALLSGLAAFGLPLGEAFQLRDDVLGVFGDAEVTGKPSGDDIREGKRTLLVARALDRADASQRTLLERSLGNPAVTAADIARVQQVMRDTGALDAVETVISELSSASLSALRRVPVEDESARTALEELSRQTTARTL